MMVGVSVYVVVPARGGSKGIPGKNLRPVGGVPLVARTVAAAIGANTVDRVFVSTDSDAIAEVAAAAGAEIIRRPAELSGDAASSESAVLHALDAIDEQGIAAPDVVVMMQCTSPFTEPDDVDGTVTLVTSGEADSAFTAAPTHVFLWKRDGGGAVAVNHDAAVRPRRQDREAEFVETGAVYAMRTNGFRESRHRFFGRVAFHEVDPERAREIDDPHDLVVAEAVAAAHRADGTGRLPSPVAGLALDFDGVLTDNRVVTFQDGSEAVTADRGDGMGIEMLRRAGLPMVVLSKERNPVVAARCDKLGLECVQAIDDKVTAFRDWMTNEGLDPAHVVFVGNDANDVECLLAAGCAVVPADAHPSARAVADMVLTRDGGRGAVRELADLVLQQTKAG
jgi:YrbI family 3-deoxy-D-manno-octulosonate 8-phosphate phosphatase